MSKYFKSLFESAKINIESLNAAKEYLCDRLDSEEELSRIDRDMLKWIVRTGVHTMRGHPTISIDDEIERAVEMKKLIDSGLTISRASEELEKDKQKLKGVAARSLANAYNKHKHIFETK